MKTVNSGLLILLILAGSYILFLRQCSDKPKTIGNDEIVIKKAVWDSIIAITHKPPIIHIDTVTLPGTIVHVPDSHIPKPVADLKDTSVTHNKDSIVNKQIKVWADILVRGKIIGIKWDYIPMTTTIEKTITQYIPQIVNNPVETPRRKLFLSGIAGGNANSFLVGGGFDFITKKQTLIGYQFQRLGSENIHSVRLGFKLF